eukprot:scaffold94715_cov48-Attheya_sp.AAC.1
MQPTRTNVGMSTVGIGMTGRCSRSVQPTIGMEAQFNSIGMEWNRFMVGAGIRYVDWVLASIFVTAAAGTPCTVVSLHLF